MENMNSTNNTVNEVFVGMMKGMLKPYRDMGQRVAIMSIPVNQLFIDKRYQIPYRTERSLDYLVKNWDEHKLLPLTVVPHDEIGMYAMVDGYGRYTASQIKDAEKYKELLCLVILDAPKDPEERLKFEATQYAFQNANVSIMKPVQKHGAGQVLNDPAVKILDTMQEKYGFNYAYTGGPRNAGVLGSYSHWYEVAKRQGAECVEYVLDICKRLRYDEVANGYSTAILNTFRDMWILFPDYRTLIADFIEKKFRGVLPEDMMASGIAKYSRMWRDRAVSMYMEDLVCKKFNLPHGRQIIDNKVVRIKVEEEAAD